MTLLAASDSNTGTGATIAALALAVSLVSFLITFTSDRRAERRARMPALVFVWDLAKDQWVVRNIGNGAAIDVVVAQRVIGDDPKASHKVVDCTRDADTELLLPEGSWYAPVRIPALGQDTQFLLWWLPKKQQIFGLGARYYDIVAGDKRRRRSEMVTVCRRDVSKIYHGSWWHGTPMKDFDDTKTPRHWKLRGAHQRGGVRGKGLAESVTRLPEA
jgi:hypothetical protein